jgi:ribosomal protein S18 acetylase RimI-like enzyme
MNSRQIEIKLAKGKETENYLDQIAALRIEVFREFPYLYDGDISYEKTYLQKYVQSSKSLFVIALSEGNIIGFSSALPLIDAETEFHKTFLDNNLNLKKFFYFGESVLKKDFRGQGIGVKFFEEREKHASSFQEIENCCFCAVDRPSNHPLRGDYQSLDNFWTKRGYFKEDKLKANLKWKDIDLQEETTKSLNFWLKKI